MNDDLTCSEISDRTAALAALRDIGNRDSIHAIGAAIAALETEIDAWVQAIPVSERAKCAVSFRENELAVDILTSEGRRQLKYVIELLEGRDPHQTSTSYYWSNVRGG